MKKTSKNIEDKEKSEMTNEILKLRNRYKTVFNNTETPIVIWDNNYQIKDWNVYAEKLFGWPKKEVINNNLVELLINKDEKEFVSSLLNKTFENLKTHFISKNQTTEETICCEWCNIPIVDFDNQVIEVVSIIKDVVSDNNTYNDLMYYDPLTGVYNRRYYEEEIKRLDTSRQLPLSIIIADVNRLKLNNDIFGHQQGDDLLKEVAEIIDSATRAEDMIARWGGDEFGILLPKTSKAQVKKIIKRIKNECNNSDLKPIAPSISLGFATKERTNQRIDNIFNRAENNMYKDKEKEKLNSEDRILTNLLRYLETKLEEEKTYSQKVINLAEKMGKKLDLDEYELEKLILLAKYHDIGKVGISNQILNKNTTLNNEEWKKYLRHLQLGYDIAKSFSKLTPIADEILHHHESWNGTGYPDHLSQEEIPFLSRVIYIVSYYTELIFSVDCGLKMNVNCQANYSKNEALQKIDDYAGTLFDPSLVEVFLKLF